MLRLWRMLKSLSKFSKYLVPLGGCLLVLLNWLEGVLHEGERRRKADSVPSARPFKIGETDGTFTQVHVEKGNSKKDKLPTGVQPDNKTELEGKGSVRPVSSRKHGEPDTQNLIDETEKYLRQ